jgi:site-specific DNA-cytosine methylase
MVACISRSLNVHEARYPAWKGELLAVVWAVRHFKPYLAGRDFTVVTDHRPLLWLMSAAELAGQQERWVLALQEFSFCVQHREGVSNPADLPSRYPITSSADPTGARLDEEGSFKRVLPKVVFASEEARQRAIQEFVEGTSVRVPGAAAALFCVCEQQPCMPAAWASAACFDLCGMVSSQEPVAAAVVEVVFGGEELDLDCSAEEEGVCPMAGQLAAWAGDLVAVAGVSPGEQGHLSQFYGGLEQGVVVVELFGGLCAGLEAVLKNGWKVRQYVYADKDAGVRRVAAHRLAALAAKYPAQLPLSAVQQAFTFWPQDVWQLQSRHLQQLEQLTGSVVLWAGWECQDLSPAGFGKGLLGPRSSTFFALHSVLQGLQQRLGPRLAWVLENTAMDVPWQPHQQVLDDAVWLRQQLGEPVLLDAAQFGSKAHRLRYYWTNLAPVPLLTQVLSLAERPPGQLVQRILGPGRQCRPVARNDASPFYVCNRVGQPMQALPTLMAKVASRAFSGTGQGTIWDEQLQAWTEPLWRKGRRH